MSPDEFRALLGRHGGVSGHQILDPQIDASTTDRLTGQTTTTKAPNPSPRVKYVTRDGEITARQKEDGTFEVIDDPKGFLKDDGPTAAGAKPIEVSSGASLVQKQPDGSYKPVYSPDQGAARPMSAHEKAQLDITRAGQDLQTRRLELDQEVARGRMTREQRNDALAEAVQRANQDIAKARLAVDQQSAALANRREDRLVAQEGRRQTIDEATLGDTRGRSAVTNAEKRYLYERERAYAAARAGGKSPEQAISVSMQTAVPDFDQIAEAAAQKAVQGLYGLPAAPRPAASAGGMPVAAGARPSDVAAAAMTAPPPTGAPAPLVAPLSGGFNPADYAPDAAVARSVAAGGQFLPPPVTSMPR